MSYLQQLVSGKRLITAMELSEPSPNCIVCGTAQLQLTINTAKTPLQDFVDKVGPRQEPGYSVAWQAFAIHRGFILIYLRANFGKAHGPFQSEGCVNKG